MLDSFPIQFADLGLNSMQSHWSKEMLQISLRELTGMIAVPLSINQPWFGWNPKEPRNFWTRQLLERLDSWQSPASPLQRHTIVTHPLNSSISQRRSAYPNLTPPLPFTLFQFYRHHPTWSSVCQTLGLRPGTEPDLTSLSIIFFCLGIWW